MADLKQKPLTLPPAFLLGAASSAHQAEGNNTKSDWWQAELAGKVPRSGPAADHYNKFAEDFGLAKQIGLNAIRLSIEWGRIEPSEGEFDASAIAHYRQVLQEAKAQGLSRMVTLHHFTLPIWLAESGGFLRKDSAKLFAKYAEHVARELGNEIELWCTINEPDVYTVMGFRYGIWPPFRKTSFQWLKVLNKLVEIHKAAYRAIKNILPEAQIGIAKNNAYYRSVHRYNLIEWSIVKFSNYTRNDYFLWRIRNQMDYMGLNYYFYHPIDWLHLKKSLDIHTQTEPKTDMGWRIYPQGLYRAIKSLRKYHKPIYVTESGLADAADAKRYDFIAQHLQATAQAIHEGCDVRGYYYWALTDNYEWVDGFGPRFGLIAIDYSTQARTIRPSSKIFSELKP